MKAVATVIFLVFTGILVFATSSAAQYYPCGGANGQCGAPSHHWSGNYPCGGANGPCGGRQSTPQTIVVWPNHRPQVVVVGTPPSLMVGQPAPVVTEPSVTVIQETAPQSGMPQYTGESRSPRLVQPQPRLRQVNMDTATLMKRGARIQHHTYGKPPYPGDVTRSHDPLPGELRPGEAVVICNAASGPYALGSESQYNGRSYHKQQCWRYDNPLDGLPVEEEVVVR